MTATTITSAKLRANLADALEAVTKGEVVLVKRRGKPDVALVDTDLLEDILAASNPAYLRSIQQSREQYKKGDILSLDEAFEGI